jgi:predicted RecA/RadA family phage recombinase
MAKNEVFKDADGLSLPVPTGTLSGAPLRIGLLNVVAITDEGSVTDGDNVINGFAQPTGGIGNKPGFASVKTSGAFNVPVATARNVGDPVYITSTNTLTGTATGNFLWGVALRAKGTGTDNLLVRLVQPGQITASA